MKHEERAFGKEFQRDLERYGAYTRVLHGSVYQPGMPDRFVASRTTGFSLVELKVDGCDRLPDRVTIVAQLEGPQVLVVSTLWTLKQRCYVACKHLQTGKVFVATHDEILPFDNTNLFVGWLLTCSI